MSDNFLRYEEKIILPVWSRVASVTAMVLEAAVAASPLYLPLPVNGSEWILFCSLLIVPFLGCLFQLLSYPMSIEVRTPSLVFRRGQSRLEISLSDIREADLSDLPHLRLALSSFLGWPGRWFFRAAGIHQGVQVTFEKGGVTRTIFIPSKQPVVLAGALLPAVFGEILEHR